MTKIGKLRDLTFAIWTFSLTIWQMSKCSLQVCKGSGYTFSSYNTHWVRQPAGKALEWIVYSGLGLGYHDSLKSRFSISKNGSNNIVTSEGQRIQTEETAVYYCVRYNDTQWYIFFTFRYSVPKSPTVSLLSAPIGTTQYLMCMIEDFTSETVKVTWKKNDMEVEGQTPTLGKQPSGLYSGSSLLKVNSDWNNKVKYSCMVEHQDQTISKVISKTGLSSSVTWHAFFHCFHCFSPFSEPLTVTLNPPRVREVFLDNQAVLECVITGTDLDTVSGTTITWQVNGQDKMDGIDLKDIESKGNLNSRVSTLTIDQTEWTNVNKVQCSAMKSGEDTPVIQDISFTKGSRSLKHLNVVVISGHILQVLERETQDVQTFAPAQR
uniref:Ig-like domain-containing protein n=1 Tax=Oncorhynchus kisutch TaxID=8019 RepID=A0A8C7JP91_ONCKI